MRKIVLIFVFLIMGLFLLSTTLGSETADPAEVQAGSPEEKIFEKFQGAKGWIQEKQPLIDSFIADNMENLKKGINDILEGISAEVEELKNIPYTEM